MVPEVDTPPELVGRDEVVLEMETVGGLVGVASGSLPAAFASTGSNVVYVRSVRYARSRSYQLAYGIIQICPMWDRCIEGNGKRVPKWGDKQSN